MAGGGREPYVTARSFRRLLANLRQLGTWYEVFLLIDGGTRGRTVEDDHRLSRDEWVAAIEGVRAAGRSWAPYAAFAHAHASDFDAMDRDHGGFITLDEFFTYVRAAGSVVKPEELKTSAGPPMPPPPPLPPHPPKEAFVIRNGRLLTAAEVAAEEKAAAKA